jgi:glycerophosphoryl diester phosphodiesterase
MVAFAMLGLNAPLHAQSGPGSGGGGSANANYNPFGYSADLIMKEVENPHSDLTMVVAHRGLHALVDGSFPTIPENSLKSIRLAAQNGLEMVEVDLKLSNDGVPMLSHDENWGRETCYLAPPTFFNFDPFTPEGSYWNDYNNPVVRTVRSLVE